MPATTPATPTEDPLALVNLTYVSRCRLAVEDRDAAIDALVRHARRSNTIDGITGALLFTGTRFVQTLEGPAPPVDAAMARIERDPRHTHLVVVDRHTVASRHFDEWTLAYSGPSVAIALLVRRAVIGAHRGETYDVNRLLLLVREFGRRPSPSRP